MNAISNYFGLRHRRRRHRGRTHAIENWMDVETPKNASVLCALTATTTIVWTRRDGCDADGEHLFSSSPYALDGSRTLSSNAPS